MKDLKIGLSVVVILSLLWAGLQALSPRVDQKKSAKSSSCESSGGG